MNNRWIVVISIVLGFLVAASGCNNGGNTADPGTLTITIINTSAGPGEFGAYLYPAGTGDIYDSANCLALFSIPIVQTEETITLEGNSGWFVPNGNVWMGDPGWGKYDLYILIDVNGTGDLEEGVGDRTNDYPSTVLIDGDTTITLDYFNDLIER